MHGERPKEYGLDNAEDRGICSNAQRKCKHGRRSETTAMAERPKGVASVPAEVLEPAPADIFDVFFDLRDVAEFPERTSLRVDSAHAGSHVVIDQVVPVELDFIADTRIASSVEPHTPTPR